MIYLFIPHSNASPDTCIWIIVRRVNSIHEFCTIEFFTWLFVFMLSIVVHANLLTEPCGSHTRLFPVCEEGHEVVRVHKLLVHCLIIQEVPGQILVYTLDNSVFRLHFHRHFCDDTEQVEGMKIALEIGSILVNNFHFTIRIHHFHGNDPCSGLLVIESTSVGPCDHRANNIEMRQRW